MLICDLKKPTIRMIVIYFIFLLFSGKRCTFYPFHECLQIMKHQPILVETMLANKTKQNNGT